MFLKRVGSLLVLVMLVVGLLPSASAQEGPPQVGLRPDAPPYALHGPYWVGVTHSVVETPSHPANLSIWYPALNPDGAAETTTYDYTYLPDLGVLPVAGHALREAAADTSGGPYPLVIYVHGLGEQRLAQGWLCEHLASYGFVVAAMDQVDNTGHQDTEGAGLLRRPQEVTWLIDHVGQLAATEGTLQGLADLGRVAVVGISFGGYTALASGGAHLDWDYFDTWCQENYDSPRTMSVALGINFCDFFAGTKAVVAPLAGLESSQTGVWPSWGDPRVDAIVPVAPAFWMIMGPEGMKSITVPALIIGGTGDTFVSPEWNSFYDNLGSTNKALVSLAGANHLILNRDCHDVPWMLEWPDGYRWCSDAVWEMDRLHDLGNHFITAFLLTTLKNDSQAAAALAPDAVQFPGITYQAAGF